MRRLGTSHPRSTIPCIIALVTCPLSLRAQSIVVNEFLAANVDLQADPDGDYSDWIELHNPSLAAVDLSDYTLTDDPGDPARWTLPPVVLDPGEFLLVWASGKDRLDPADLHTAFRLDRGGEFIGLYSPAGAPVDTLSFGEQSQNISRGRLPDGGAFVFLGTPSPGATNDASSPTRVELVFSLPQGEYAGAASLEITADPEGGDIRYTTDGSLPDAGSALYAGPVAITESQVIRARVFAGSEPRSEIECATYVIGDRHHLPILALVTDPSNLWDPDTGIMVHFEERGREWERDVHVSLIEDHEITRFAVPAGIRIHGGWNRRLAKKSFRLYFRRDYGPGRLDHALFPGPVSDYDRLLVHSGSEDHPIGFDTWTLLRESLSAALMAASNVLTVAYRPVAVVLNGDDWGLFWLRERIDDAFLESHFGLPDVDLLENGPTPEIKAGDLAYWNETMDFLEANDTGDPRVFAQIQEKYVDTESFIDFNVLNIFAGNWDWPHNNNLRYHDRSGPTPWRWLLWDVDNAWASELAADHNTLEWATRDELRPDLAYAGYDDEEMLWGTYLLRRLLENDDFRTAFINRFADLLNTVLATDGVVEQIDELAADIADEIPLEIARWADWWTPDDWQVNLDLLRDFAAVRPGLLRRHIQARFGLTGTSELTIEPAAGGGVVQVNTLMPATLPWSGTYFRGVPITLAAIPAAGFEFSGWSDPGLPRDTEIALLLDGDRTLHARFEAAGVSVGPPGAPELDDRLGRNVPNPFNPRTTIEYALPEPASVRLSIYNSLGRRVRTLVDGRQAAGTYRVEWDGRTDRGMVATSGVYLYRLEAADFVQSRAMLLLK